MIKFAVVARWWEQWTIVQPYEDGVVKNSSYLKSPFLYGAPMCLAIAFIGIGIKSVALWTLFFLCLVASIVFVLLVRKFSHALTEAGLFIGATVILILIRLLLVDHVYVANDIAKHFSTEEEGQIYTMQAVLEQDVQKAKKSFGETENYFAKAALKTVKTTNSGPKEFNMKVMIFSSHGLNSYQYGDRIEFNARVQETERHQRNRYLIRTQSHVSLVRAARDVYGTEFLRRKLRTELVRGLDADVAALEVGMTTGDRSLFSDELDGTMKRTGLTHLTAVSGSNCAILVGFVVFLLRCLKCRKTVVTFITALALFYFVILVRPDASVVRAFSMAVIALASLNFGRPRQALHCLAVVLLLLVLWDPYFSRDYSFLLSVFATLGIILWAQAITKVLSHRIPTALAVLISVPVSAQILCAPIIIFLQPYVALYSIPANIFAAPIVAPITIIGMLALAISPLSSGLAMGCVQLASYGASWILGVANFFSQAPGAAMAWPQGVVGALSLLFVNCAGTGTIVALVLPVQLRKKFFQVFINAAHVAFRRAKACFSYCKKNKNGLGRLLGFLVCCFMALYVGFHPTLLQWKSQWSIVMCDVGQGDAFIVQNSRSEAFLIDTGNETGKLAECVANSRAKIHSVFITHFHDDHYAALQAVYHDGMPVYASAASSGIPEGDEKRLGLKNVHYIDADFSAEFGNIGLKVLWPRPGYHVDANAENNASLVLALEFTLEKGVKYDALFTGDLEEDAAKAMFRTQEMPDKVDVLKIAHHGAKNGGTQAIEHYKPVLALASMGKKNKYRHPHREIVSALERYGAFFGRTDRDGTLFVHLTPAGIKVYAHDS